MGPREVVKRRMFGAAVLGLLALAVASLPGLDEIRDRLGGAGPGWLVAALALELGSCLAFVVAFRAVLAERLPWRTSYEVGMAVQGTNVLLPAGGVSGLAVGAWALRRLGLPGDRLTSRAIAFFLITSSVNFATAILAGFALALGLLPGDAPLALTAGPAALAVLAVAVVLAAPWLPGPLAGGVREARVLVRSGSVALIAGAVGYMALDIAALGAAFAAIGTVPPLGILLLGYVLGQLGGLLPLPGGVGGADSGVIGALFLYGTPLGEAAAAVLAYRAFQLGLPALLGSFALLRLPSATSAASATPRPAG
jgi:uncharacterized membrane protein YbhN (UPF0104 family)